MFSYTKKLKINRASIRAPGNLFCKKKKFEIGSRLFVEESVKKLDSKNTFEKLPTKVLSRMKHFLNILKQGEGGTPHETITRNKISPDNDN